MAYSSDTFVCCFLQNTVKDTSSALRTYEGFSAVQLAQPGNPNAAIFAKRLTELTIPELIIALGLFVLGVRKTIPTKGLSAEPFAYPPKTLQQLLRGLDRHLKEDIEAQNSFLALEGRPLKSDPKLLSNPALLPMRNALDRRIRELTRLGIGLTKKQADDLTQSQEEVRVIAAA
jgi:hypothetical protein